MFAKGWAILIYGMIIVFMPSQTSSKDKDLDSSWKNADFVITDFSVLQDYSIFGDSKKNEGKVSSRDRNEMQAWYFALRKASALLPTDLVKEIATDFDDDCLWGRNMVSMTHHVSQCVPKWIKFKFFIDNTFWGTAFPDRINLRPSVTDLPNWLTWEPFPKDGYSEEERIWIALHEFAHRYRQVSGQNFVLSYITDSPSTFYGCAMGPEETFADTFALYIMFPDRLTQFSLVYDEIKGILGREYQAQFQMPNSVASKLTNLKDGCKQYDEDVARIRANQGVVNWDIR